MRQIIENSGELRFRGSVENREDLLAAAMIAGDCSVYSIDDDDEDYCEGARTCFNCRYRRWLADGFLCVKGLLENTNSQSTT
jgi:hypothetical protein